MTDKEALREARKLYGDSALSVTTSGVCVISVKENGYYIPFGYGETWQAALIDCAGRFAFAEECCYT